MKKLTVVLIPVLVVVLIFGALLLVGCGGGSTTQLQTLASGTFTVPAGEYNSIEFNGGLFTKVSGSFYANGDIEVFIFDETDYSNWEYGQWQNDIYWSGRKSSGSITVENLEEGAHTYYLVYSNRFSLFTDKVVTTNVQLISK
jgi:hypothetical protein